MQVKKVTLTNFRNYPQASVELWHERNILLGENAQGKSNFIEAIELMARGSSDRAISDSDLIRMQANDMQIQLTFEADGRHESLAVSFRKTGEGGHAKSVIEKTARVNGISYSSLKPLRGRLSIVSFKSEDLGLLRAGPKFRRDWLDQIALSLKPTLQDRFARYHKSVSQRNRLLKNLFEKGRVSTTERDELRVWDEQLAQNGSQIIKERLNVLQGLLNKGGTYQAMLSEQQEALSANYQLKTSQNQTSSEDAEESTETRPTAKPATSMSGIPDLTLKGGQDGAIFSIEVKEIGEILLRSYRENRYEEISRRQTLFGPHRDDIVFYLSDKQATAFASQGQQRSLVLAMKLAELKLVSDNLNEAPVLLLDDVLAELDLNRQSLLMSLIRNDMQTIITTTHISGFRPEWLEKAAFIYVKEGSLERQEPDSSKEDLVHSGVDLG